MDLISQVFLLRSAASSSVAAGGAAGSLFGVILISLVPLFFLEPYYNSFIQLVTQKISISPFNSMVPLTIMGLSVVGFLAPVFVGKTKPHQWFIYVLLKRMIRVTIMVMFTMIFMMASLHWLFYSKGFNI